MAPEQGSVSAALETKDEELIPRALHIYATAFFVLSSFWLLAVTVLLFLSGISVVHISDPVLIAAIATMPALFVVFGFLFRRATTRPHFANFERDPTTGKYRMLV